MRIKITFGAVALLLLAGVYFAYVLNTAAKPRNVILIGWDGAQREVVYDLLNKGNLPNLRKLIDEGSIVDSTVTTGATETKPGWTEILTGYDARALGILNNKEYRPIPAGLTIFERLEDHYGADNIFTAFLTGKTANLSARGPHKFCVNCLTRIPDTYEETRWWDETGNAPLRAGEKTRIFESRDGEPYYYSVRALDVYMRDMGEAKNVGRKAVELISANKDRRFFMFFHFGEPDEVGHIYGGGSKEYRQGLMDDDVWLGEIVSELKKHDLYDTTLLYVTSDHGFDLRGHNHRDQPNIFGLATNDRRPLRKAGSRLDITPTILDRLGFDLKKIQPELDGKTLY